MAEGREGSLDGRAVEPVALAPAEPAGARRLAAAPTTRRGRRLLVGLVAVLGLSAGALVLTRGVERGPDATVGSQAVDGREDPSPDTTGSLEAPSTTSVPPTDASTVDHDEVAAPTETVSTTVAGQPGEQAAASSGSPAPSTGPSPAPEVTTTTTVAPGVPAGSVSPASVAAGGEVTIVWRVRSASGVRFTTFFAGHERGTALPSALDCPSGNDTARRSGDEHDGVYEARCRTRDGSMPGRYTVHAYTEHADGSRTDDLIATFDVVGGSDGTPPELVSGTVSPPTIRSGETFRMEWRLRSRSGVHFSTFFADSDRRSADGVGGCEMGNEVARTSGTKFDGTYSASCTTSGFPPGRYTVRAYVEDESGNGVTVDLGTVDIVAS